MKIYFLLTFYFLIPASSIFFINITQPYPLTPSLINISTIQAQFQNNFLVGFQNGQARRYPADFSSFDELSLPEAVDQFASFEIDTSNIEHSNSTIRSVTDKMTSALSNGFKTLRSYSYPSFEKLTQLNFNQPVLDYRGLPIGSKAAITPFHIVVLKSTIKVAYRGTVSTVFDLAEVCEESAHWSAVSFYEQTLNKSNGTINATYTYFQTVIKVGLIQTTITLSFRYDLGTQAYDLTVGSNFSKLAEFKYPISRIAVSNNVVLMQAEGGGLLLHTPYATGTSPFVDNNIGDNPILKFFFQEGAFYILHSEGIVQPQISIKNAQFLANSSSLWTSPSQEYRLLLGSVMSIVYVPSTPYLYKVGCSGQSYSNKGICVSYNCSDKNCAECPFTASTCQNCVKGYRKNDLKQCSLDFMVGVGTYGPYSPYGPYGPYDPYGPYYPPFGPMFPGPTNTTTSNSTNSTNATANTTNTTNTANATNTTNTTNATNTTNTTNTTNATNVNSTANVTNVTNTSNPIQEPQSSQSLSQSIKSLKGAITKFINSTQALISIPSLRQASMWFYFFGNFDDLYLYMFHDRLYGPTFTSLFEQVNTIETEKWNALNFAGELSWLSANSSLALIANYQQDYLTYAYNTPGRPSEGSEGLLTNCKSFFVAGLPMLIIGFILLRWLFSVLWRFPVSRLLRKFDFWGFLFFLIFQGNIQQFAFYITAELKNAFSFTYGDRFMKAGVVWFGLILIIVSLGGLLVTFGTYRRLNLYLADNNHNTLRGNSFLLLQSGVRNLLLGALHSLLRTLPYFTMLSALVTLESFFLLVFTVSVGINTYLRVFPIWTYLTLALIRILLVSTLFLDYNSVGDPLMEKVQITLLILMILVYLIGTFMAVTASTVELVETLVKIVKGACYGQNFFSHKIKLSKNVTIVFNRSPQVKKKKSVARQMKSQKQRATRKTNLKTVFKINNRMMEIVEVNALPKKKPKTILYV